LWFFPSFFIAVNAHLSAVGEAETGTEEPGGAGSSDEDMDSDMDSDADTDNMNDGE
jgi:hypothetical protein